MKKSQSFDRIVVNYLTSKNQNKKNKMTSEKKNKYLPLLFLLVAGASFFTGALFSLWMVRGEPFFGINHSVSSDTVLEEEFSKETFEEESQERPDSLPQNQEESLNRYREMLKKTFDDETNLEDSLEYGIFISRFSQNEKANDFAVEIKSQYPYWRLTVYPQDDFFRVVIGPFESKEETEEFFKNLPQKYEFRQARVIQISPQ